MKLKKIFNIVKNSTQLYTTLHNYTQLYKTSQQSTKLNKTFTNLYKTLQRLTKLYNTSHTFTTIYKTFHDSETTLLLHCTKKSKNGNYLVQTLQTKNLYKNIVQQISTNFFANTIHNFIQYYKT